MFAFDIFGIEIVNGGFRLALLEVACGGRAGALIALEVSAMEFGLEIRGDLLWFSLFAFNHGGSR